MPGMPGNGRSSRPPLERDFFVEVAIGLDWRLLAAVAAGGCGACRPGETRLLAAFHLCRGWPGAERCPADDVDDRLRLLRIGSSSCRWCAGRWGESIRWRSWTWP